MRRIPLQTKRDLDIVWSSGKPGAVEGSSEDGSHDGLDLANRDEHQRKYFPYSFNVEKGYLDPQFSYVPSVMLSKRHKLEEFHSGCMIRVEILNNAGDVNFAP